LSLSSSARGMKRASEGMLGCGGGGDGLTSLVFESSRIEALLGGGGGISAGVALLEADAVATGCLDACRLEPARGAFGAGVAEPPRTSPIVMRINSLRIPSSLYVNCIGDAGRE
jgi:hypothetical protein